MHRGSGHRLMRNDDDDRANPTGLYNFAHSYWRSAVALQRAEVKATHPQSPVWFLYAHAIELYLKAFLRADGSSVAELRNCFRHNVCKLTAAAVARGLWLDDEDKEVRRLLENTDDLLALRYLRTGPFTRPAHEAMDRTCSSLNETVGTFLRERDHPVRVRNRPR